MSASNADSGDVMSRQDLLRFLTLSRQTVQDSIVNAEMQWVRHNALGRESRAQKSQASIDSLRRMERWLESVIVECGKNEGAVGVMLGLGSQPHA